MGVCNVGSLICLKEARVVHDATNNQALTSSVLVYEPVMIIFPNIHFQLP